MPLHEYHFRSTWAVPAAPAAVFAALVDLGNYPRWWPDVRSVAEVDGDTAAVVCRAVLPYALSLRMRRAVQDEPGGRVRVDLSGDLEGYVGSSVTATEDGTRLDIEQGVVVTKRLLRVLAPVARPVLIANHRAMMWRGSRGLARYLG